MKLKILTSISRWSWQKGILQDSFYALLYVVSKGDMKHWPAVFIEIISFRWCPRACEWHFVLLCELHIFYSTMKWPRFQNSVPQPYSLIGRNAMIITRYHDSGVQWDEISYLQKFRCRYMWCSRNGNDVDIQFREQTIWKFIIFCFYCAKHSFTYDYWQKATLSGCLHALLILPAGRWYQTMASCFGQPGCNAMVSPWMRMI